MDGERGFMAAPPRAAAPVSSTTATVATWVVVVGGIAAIAGTSLPWTEFDSFGPVIEVIGMETGDGRLVAMLAAIALIVGVSGIRRRRSASILLGAVATVGGGSLAIYDLARTSRVSRPAVTLGLDVSAGGGLYVSAVGMVLLFIGLVIGRASA